ncbi:MAG: YtxH domain-containing protein [Stackebrandtia sp.]
MRKLMFAAGVAVGYVLGSRAGRERYEQIVGMARKFRQSPAIHNAAESLKHQTGHVAGVCRDRVMETDLVGRLFNANRETDLVDDNEPKPQYWETAGVTTPARASRDRNGTQQGF